MSIFIDSGIFIAYINTRDEHHVDASAILEDIMQNRYGPAFSSNLVFNEAVTFILYKTGDIGKATRIRDLILGNEEENIPRFINILYVDEGILKDAWTSFVRYADRKLSFTDCTSLTLMRNRNVEHMASFDSDFDGIVSKILK